MKRELSPSFEDKKNGTNVSFGFTKISLIRELPHWEMQRDMDFFVQFST